MDKLPLEIQEKILWYLRNDSLSLHRAENVCLKWANLIGFFEKHKRLQFRKIKVKPHFTFLVLQLTTRRSISLNLVIF